jgi:glycolate oxidase FAD binding subunit
VDLSATLGLDAARVLDPARFAIAGAVPRAALRPANREELAEALRAAAHERLAVVPWGGGVGLAGADAPTRYDLALDLTALDRIVAYEPEDFTLTAECGVTMTALVDAVATRGQELPLECAHASRATFGGVLAANSVGPRRLRFGSPRDRILGAHFALGDGTLVKSGGRVVKNVAGYAIHRLLCGSRGALGVFVEAAIKLAPAPHTRLAMIWAIDAKTLADSERYASLARLEPAWWVVLGRDAARGIAGLPDAPFVIVTGLEDDPGWVATQRARFTDAVGVPHAMLESADALALSRAIADRDASVEPGQLGFVSAHVTPAALAPLITEPEIGSARFTATGGRLVVTVSSGRADGFATRALEAGFSWVDRVGSAEFNPPLAPQSAVTSLRARIRTQLDAGGAFAFGERWAG